MKFVRAMAALGAMGILAIPSLAQAGTRSTSLTISQFSAPAFGLSNPAFGGTRLAFGGSGLAFGVNGLTFGGGNANGQPICLPVRRVPTHPLPGFPIRRGRPVVRSNSTT